MVAHPGLAFGEMFDLDALSAESNADEIYEFMFAASPLPITGASGCPVSALATSVDPFVLVGHEKGQRNSAVSRGTGWAHFGHTRRPQRSILVNHNQMSFRSSVPVRLRDQHPETGSIPGSSTENAGQGRRLWPVSHHIFT